MNKAVFERKFTVGHTRVDVHGRMMPAELLRHAQEVSMEHTDAIGIGAEFMLSIQRVFLLSKVRLTIHRAPAEGEKIVSITTAHCPDRIIYRRTTEFATESGAPIASLDSRWVLVDTETNRITRKQPDFILALFQSSDPAPDFKPQPDIVYDTATTLPVSYHMLDVNRHINNAMYADIALDLIGEKLLDGAQVKEISIFYHREARLSDEFTLQSKCTDDSLYVRGDIASGHSFDAEVRFE